MQFSSFFIFEHWTYICEGIKVWALSHSSSYSFRNGANKVIQFFLWHCVLCYSILFCRSLFVPLSVFFFPLYCLVLWRILITSLVPNSSNPLIDIRFHLLYSYIIAFKKTKINWMIYFWINLGNRVKLST